MSSVSSIKNKKLQIYWNLRPSYCESIENCDILNIFYNRLCEARENEAKHLHSYHKNNDKIHPYRLKTARKIIAGLHRIYNFTLT